MCGRFSLAAEPSALIAVFGPMVYDQLALAHQAFGDPTRPGPLPRYNIAPTQQIPVVRLGPAGQRQLSALRWGLIPSWSQRPGKGPLMINARAETVASKPAYRAAFQRRRCLIPSDGFYEWRSRGKAKQPYRIRRRDGALMAYAAIWERWQGPQTGEQPRVIESASIVTVPANAVVEPLHGRMPAILDPTDFATWLGGQAQQAQALLAPSDDALLERYPVSVDLNKAGNEGASLWTPVEDALDAAPRLPLFD